MSLFQYSAARAGARHLGNRVVSCGVVAALGMALAAGANAADTGTPTWQAGPVTLSFGGYTALETLYRNRYEGTDIGSDYNTKIPYPDQTTTYNTSEFRETARQSRLTILAQGPVSDGYSAEGYFEMDFLGDAQNANSNESNSYTPRVRNIYGMFRDSNDGLYFLAGQNWSLVTLTRTEMNPRSEITPLTIDAQYAVGFNWTRNPQLRVVKSWNDQFAIGFSLESPQAQFCSTCTTPSGTVTSVAGTQQLVSASSLAVDFVPDVVLKVAADPGYGHYELYGLGRGFRDRDSITGANNTTYGGGLGGAILLPLVPKMLELQVSGLFGNGIGRYGSAQLPDVTVRSDVTVAAIPEYDVLVGLVFKPTSTWTFYAYGGVESASETAYTNATAGYTGTITGYGYGSPLYNNSGCLITTSSPSSTNCIANTKSVTQGTAGTWWKYYEGQMGNLQFGLQGSYTKRDAFAGIGGDPSTNLTVIMASFRYYPYQH